jgi:transposase
MINEQKRKAIFLLHQKGMSIRKITRRLVVGRNTVRNIIKLKGAMPHTIRKGKIRIDPELLNRLYVECDGRIQHVQKKLAEDEDVQIKYSTLTRKVRELGLRRTLTNPTQSTDAAQRWLTEITYGKRSFEILQTELDDSRHLSNLLHYLKNGRLRERKKAAVILGRKRGISNATIAVALHSSRKTTRKYFKIYREQGLSVLFGANTPRSDVRNGHIEKTGHLLELLHQRPDAFGINRTSWTQQTLTQAYRERYDDDISRGTVARLLKGAGYKWKKMRRVLTSPDPDYEVKLTLLLQTLRSLSENEMFFFIDEWGPIQVRKRGGKSYRSKYDVTTIPRKQNSKGTVSLVGALSATTNQMTWVFEATKDTRSMINLLEILYNQYQERSTLYVTWDAVSWHNSIELIDWLDDFNKANRTAPTGPIVQLVPLPVSAQFLNVIEGVFSAMTRAVIHNSDYQSSDEMKSAISRHFVDRNAYFKENPRRAGKKIWEIDFFNDYEHLRSGNYREW